jgi:hypothetical protein
MDGYIKDIRLIACFLLIMIMISCKTKKEASIPVEVEPVIEVPDGYTAMIVKDYHELESCGFLLMNNDSVFFEPRQMDPSFYQNNLKVFVKYQLSKNQMSVCMRGTKIDLLDIKVQGK